MVSTVGAQLRLVRMAWGRSLEEVGEAVVSTRQYIHQIETGARVPNEDMLRALAECLGVRDRFFHLSPASPVSPEHCHFRKQFTTPASVTSQVLARGTLLDAFVTAIDNAMELPKVNFPDIAINNAEAIERTAEECRRHWQLGATGPITNVMRVVENAGAVVTYFAGVSERVDALSMDRPRPIIVRSAAKQSLCRQRFDLAHECGHLVMHRGIVTGDHLTEEQANRFASAFLLPRAAFLNEFPRGRVLNWPALYALKKRWKVAVRAIVKRAFDLNLITAAQYRSANIHLMKTGQSKVERYDDELPMERPELLSNALSALGQVRPAMVPRIADQLGWDEGLFALIVGQPLTSHSPSNENSHIRSLRLVPPES